MHFLMITLSVPVWWQGWGFDFVWDVSTWISEWGWLLYCGDRHTYKHTVFVLCFSAYQYKV